MGDENMPALNESPVARRKKSEEDYHLQVMKEQHFLDKFHNKAITYFEAEHERVLTKVLEMDVLEEEERNTVIEYY